ncbi:Uncharacterized protein APZ42_020479 [Daphnia magna]|uniref:Uncharacterized protein n=1 Tax=Daphnia magna TaxID=35525 RepID=A0A0N8DHS1_9CRUS|nr:Uncharacterized protein APZ42_020479 [Daphnia magna]
MRKKNLLRKKREALLKQNRNATRRTHLSLYSRGNPSESPADVALIGLHFQLPPIAEGYQVKKSNKVTHHEI